MTTGAVSITEPLPPSQRAFKALALWQHGFELPTHPIKVTTQLDDDGTVREARTVHVVG